MILPGPACAPYNLLVGVSCACGKTGLGELERMLNLSSRHQQLLCNRFVPGVVSMVQL